MKALSEQVESPITAGDVAIRRAKAAVLTGINEPLKVSEVGLMPLKFGQVLVRVLVSGICGTQLQEITGHHGNPAHIPHLMGHEGCGIVEDIGVGVTKVKKGDKVVMHWRKGEGIESDFPHYEFEGKLISSGKVTTLSEYSVVSENRVTPVPIDLPNDLCALLGCRLSTALSTVNGEANIQLGESLLIVGVGGLGINLIKAAKLVGAYPVVCVDVQDAKREVAESLGADMYINSAKESIPEALQQKFGIKGFDVIIETSGNVKAIESTIPLLSGTGRYVMVGIPKPGETIQITNAKHLFGGEGKTITATQGGSFSPTSEVPRYTNLYKAGLLNIDGIITHRFSLEEINKGIDMVRAGEAGRIIIDMTRSKGVDDALKDAYDRMLRVRVAQEELARFYIENKVFSMVHFYTGQEAVAVGVCDALTVADQAVGTHRSHGYYLAKGGNFRALAAELFGRKAGVAHGKGGSMHLVDRSVGFAGSSPLLGSGVPIAAGLAFAKQQKKEDGVVVSFYGDGASEEGVVYETYNLAALHKLPILFVLENNSWSINSPLSARRAPGYDLKTIAAGLGLRYEFVNGMEYDAVRKKADALIAEIRAGKGPAILECVVYRHMAHSTPLMDEKNRDEDTLERRIEADPIRKLKETLVAAGVDVGMLHKQEESLRKSICADILWAFEQPYPDKRELDTDVYA